MNGIYLTREEYCLWMSVNVHIFVQSVNEKYKREINNLIRQKRLKDFLM